MYFDSRDAETALESLQIGNDEPQDLKLKELGLMSGELDWDDESSLSDYYTTEVLNVASHPVNPVAPSFTSSLPPLNTSTSSISAPLNSKHYPKSALTEQQEALNALLVGTSLFKSL